MKYIDKNGKIYESETAQDRLLRTLYTTYMGRALLKPLVCPVVSKAAGLFLDSGLSRCLIRPFIKSNHIDMSSYVKREYSSYNDFFTREIRPEERMIDTDPHHVASPSDGKVSAYALDGTGSFRIKHTCYTAKRLLRNRKLVEKYRHGYVVIIRLTVDDYHRYAYPADGVKSGNHFIPGILHTVNPIACETVPVYKENSREYTVIRTKEFGDILQMEVGALMVGRICNYHGKKRVRKGEEKGKFEFGGSTIVLFFEKNGAKPLPQFLENTENGCETYIRMGECIAEKIF